MREKSETMTVPEAGMKYFGLGRAASYAAARRGDLPTIGCGKTQRVLIRAMEAIMDASVKEALSRHQDSRRQREAVAS
jgi:hypothetical protein